MTRIVAAATRIETAREERQFVTALARGLDILRCFSRKDRELGNTEIATRTGLPKATVSRLAFTLTQMGYLTYSPATGRYSLSVGVLAFSNAYLGMLDVRNVARPLMQELADDLTATVSLGAPDPSSMHMVFLEICQGSGQMFRMSMEVGSRVPHGWTAMGRAYLAALEEGDREDRLAMYRKDVARTQWNDIREGIERAVRDYERHGFCLSVGEWNKDVWAVGTPMVSRDRARILALNCSGPMFDITRQRIVQEIGPRLLALRDRVAASTGGVF
ncbi:MAG TPA: IclR family transcriptional regulator [Usitatibacter sp.]|nr:IclR family transcriptional regulator [Usitatibacter sp.]